MPTMGGHDGHCSSRKASSSLGKVLSFATTIDPLPRYRKWAYHLCTFSSLSIPVCAGIYSNKNANKNPHPYLSQVKRRSSIRQFSWLQVIAPLRLPKVSPSDCLPLSTKPIRTAFADSLAATVAGPRRPTELGIAPTGLPY